MNANADSWVSPLHLSNPKLYISDPLVSALPRSEFILHPLTYVSIDFSFYPKVFVANNEETKHLFVFTLARFPLVFICLKDCQSQRFTALDKHSISV